MKALCPYCRADFPTKNELTIHLAHAHHIYSEGYFQVLLNREKSGYYMRQINYSRKRR